MNRFDHATEARALLIHGDAFTSSDMVIQTGEAKADMIAQAQVHATLALVEQQRIANLIALMDSPRVGVKAGRSALDAICPGEPFSERTLTPDIAAALGIENAS